MIVSGEYNAELTNPAGSFDYQHMLVYTITGSNWHVPLQEPRRCLDIAACTGTWTLVCIGTYLFAHSIYIVPTSNFF
jgi:23S rRNA C2498 (ribose-2'-O)-methylase RlmM